MEYWKASNCTLLPSASFPWKASFSRAEAAFSFFFFSSHRTGSTCRYHSPSSLEKLTIRNYTCKYSDLKKGICLHCPFQNWKRTLALNLKDALPLLFVCVCVCTRGRAHMHLKLCMWGNLFEHLSVSVYSHVCICIHTCIHTPHPEGSWAAAATPSAD